MSSSSTSTSQGIYNLLQVFSSAATPAISSLLSSSTVQSALAKAPASDIVQLSDQATKLQEVDDLFGSSNATTATENSNMAMQNLLTSLYTPTGSAATSSTSGSTVNVKG
jgi:hypothetical protein